MNKPKLNLAFCSHEAAKYACKNWHYSKCVPAGKLFKIGVWEDDHFIGCIIYGRGANNSLGKPYGLEQTQCCELVRIALRDHSHPVSKMISISLKILKKNNPGLMAVISFADTGQGHHGGIYQATNWIYAGKSNSADEYLYEGKRYHGRSFRVKFGSHKNYLDKGLKIVKGTEKHRYIMPLDKKTRNKILPLSQDYPKRATKATSGDHSEGGGAVPTCALQS